MNNLEMNDISKEQFVAWKNDPVTKEYLSKVKEERENFKELLASGRWKDLAEVNQVIGLCMGLGLVLNVDFTGDSENAESNSVESAG